MPLKGYSSNPLLNGSKTKEQSCATCRHRKVKCSGGKGSSIHFLWPLVLTKANSLTGRPACLHCLKVSAAQGIPPQGVICLYSAKSVFAREEDIEIEAKFGKAARCLWSKDPVMVISAKTEQDVEMRTEDTVANENEGDEAMIEEGECEF